VTNARPIGRYVIHDELAVGGMARVSLGTLRGEGGFSRVVAIKQLFPQYANDPDFVAMFLDEANVAARVQHPNVVSTLDIVSDGGELFLVMEYIAGEALVRLLRTARDRFEPIEPAIASSVLLDVLEGLYAAHTATGPGGAVLSIVHRDVSPQNVLVGVDGVSRVVDFGVAKAAGRQQTTDDGQIKGKVVYMPPEQMGKVVDQRTDLWAAGAVLWEMLAGRRLFLDIGEALAFHAGTRTLEPPRSIGKRETPLDVVAMRALSRAPEARYQTAREMIIAIERAVPPAPARRVALWVQRLAGGALEARRELVAKVEAIQPSTTTSTLAATTQATTEAAPPTPPPRPSRRLRVIVPGVLVSLAFAGVVVGVRAQSSPGTPAAPAATASASPPPAASSVVGPGAVAAPSADSASSASSAPAGVATGPSPSAPAKPAGPRHRPLTAAPQHPDAPSATELPAAQPAPPTVPSADPRELHRRK
jgi:serine/threonine-protein kinase